MGGGAGTGLSPIDELRLGIELENRAKPDPATAARNRTAAKDMALDVTPVIGNVRAALDAKDSYAEALKNFDESEYGKAAGNTGLGALSTVGAVFGVPVGKWAKAAARGGKDRLNTFIPVEKGTSKARQAEDMRKSGFSNETIWQKTKGVYEPGGQLLEETPAHSIKVNRSKLRVGDETELGKIVDHPELFERFPQFRHLPTHITDRTFGKAPGAPVFRNLPDSGDLELSIAPGDLRAGIDKVLQYSINNATGLSSAVRHVPNPVPAAVDDTVKQMQAVDPTDRSVREALTAYLDKISGEKKAVLDTLAQTEPRKHLNVNLKSTNRVAGNALSRIVNSRAGIPDNQLQTYPYSRGAKYMNANPHSRLPVWSEMFPLPQPNASPDDLAEFLLRWRDTGTGMPPDAIMRMLKP